MTDQQPPQPPRSAFATGLGGFIQTNHASTSQREQVAAAEQTRLAAANAPPPKPVPKPAAPRPSAPPRRITAVRRGSTIAPDPRQRPAPVVLNAEDREDLEVLLEAFRDFQRGE